MSSDPSIWMSARELLPCARPGDLIEFRRVGYCHWGMYSDQAGGYVFHASIESKNSGKKTRFLEQKVTAVAKGSRVRINNQSKIAKSRGLKSRSPTEALAAARKVLEKETDYHLTTRNCETYCTEWKYGQGFSDQGETVDTVVAGAAGVAVAVGCTCFVGFVLANVIQKNRSTRSRK